VGRLIADLPLRDKVQIANLRQDELIYLHFSLGMGIRNLFGLWAGNGELLKPCSLLAGVNHIHPDDGSAVIITELWKRLRETHALRAVK